METRHPLQHEAASWAEALIHSRRTTLPKRLVGPGPDPTQRMKILAAASAAPDHDQLLPWRLVEIPIDQRHRLATAFGQALLERDPQADAEAQAMAQEKAHRSPWLLLVILKKGDGTGDVPDSERLLSCGAAIQNMLLQATAMGLGSSLTSGKALASSALRKLFQLAPNEEAVCFINIGHIGVSRRARARPSVDDYFSRLS
jgi:nitroreductase